MLLARDYWLVRSRPSETTTTEDIERVADEHVAWLLKLEPDGPVPGVEAGRKAVAACASR